MRFALGMLLATPAAKEEMKLVGIDEIDLLGRHQEGDWSEMDPEDMKSNEEAVDQRLRIFSAYTYGRVKFWVITEADRSATTILLPSEY